MKLLFDQNISFRIIKKIESVLPESKHVGELNLTNASDHAIWEFASANNYCIVTSDSDFIDISTLRGGATKVIWVRLGNTSTDNIAVKLIAERERIAQFLKDQDSRFLQIS